MIETITIRLRRRKSELKAKAKPKDLKFSLKTSKTTIPEALDTLCPSGSTQAQSEINERRLMMKRREFLTSSVAAASVAGLTSAFQAAAAEGKEAGPREFYELRQYHQRRGPKVKMLDDYLRTAAVPAFNRAGINPVGVFNVMIGPDSPTVYLLLPFKNFEAFATLPDKMKADEEYLKAGAEFTNAPATDPLYIRVESSFLVAFEGMPKLEVPAAASEKKPRIFELRIYESHNKKANKKKIEMFNRGCCEFQCNFFIVRYLHCKFVIHELLADS